MNAKKLYYVLVSCVVLLGLGFIGIAEGTNTLLKTQASHLSTLKADETVLDTLQTNLSKNKRDLTKYSDLNKIAESIVPQDKDQAEAVREIVNLAAASGIGQLSSVTFPASTLGTLTPGSRTSPSLTQLTPVVGIPGVYDLQITVTQDSNNRIPYDQFISFLQKLEQNRRTAQVSNISIQPNSLNPNMIAFTLIIDEFIKP